MRRIVRIEIDQFDLRRGTDPEKLPSIYDVRLPLTVIWGCEELIYTAPSGTVHVLKQLPVQP